MHQNATVELEDYLIEDKDAGQYKIHRSMFTDPALFELELKHIWEKVWVYIGHESQIAKKKDFITGYIGRQPIILNRDKSDNINVFLNACRHRGAKLCKLKKGNQGLFACPFHGWTYGANGELKAVTDQNKGGYPEQFDKDDYPLERVPSVENYRGFIFASLDADAPPLQEWLGDTTRIIDMMVNQSPKGLEVLKGSSSYTYNGNWKLQAENGVDGYHVGTVHWNYVATMKNRAKINLAGTKTKTMDVNGLSDNAGGYFDFGNGHTLLWGDWPNPQDRPIYGHKEEFAEKHGEAEANWMVGRLRNQLIFPNVFLMDQMSSQIRMFRPIAVDKTEVTIFVLAPVGEAPDLRRNRLRQYEDFFNASGMATADDLSEFESCQEGSLASASPWSDISRGAIQQVDGGNQYAEEIGLKPHSSGAALEDEGIFIAQHRNWLKLMTQGIANDAKNSNTSKGQS
ncbi:MAG: Rieske 2Fe-2S domain-containing protein [bacterium]|jgi:benzoate/toluate 1,2-dioxygenase alpha subunit|nr:benzoate 1,2-dioxygenase large subunit [Gammaproteobacteria bacterium]HIL84536.1 benzoate 1,2-dioxygenase large subunit [Pseudomonadales bacterium]